MTKLSIRDKLLSKRAIEQLPIPFGSQEAFNEAIQLANHNPNEYFDRGHHLNINFDNITERLLETTIATDPDMYRKWIYSNNLSYSKFNYMNLKWLATELQEEKPAEFLKEDWYKVEQVIPDTPERTQLVNKALSNILEESISEFWQVADTWNMPVSSEVRDSGREIAMKIAMDDPEAYFEEHWLGTSEGLSDITDDARDNLAREYPKKYLDMLNGQFWDDWSYQAGSFEIMARSLADNDPGAFFEDLYDNRSDYRENNLIIPADAIITAGEWIAENNPEQYIELGLNDVQELSEITQKLGLQGATLPKELSKAGYQLSVDTEENNFMSVYISNYPDAQRHPDAKDKTRFDISLSWPINDPARKVQKVVSDDYTGEIHEIGNASATKSFALVAPDIENRELLVEEIQSDYPTVLHNMRRDNHFTRAKREGVKEEEYNDYVKRMSEHMAAYPYLMIQRLAEFADQNEHIDNIKISSLGAVMRMAGISNEKKARKVYDDIPKELGFVSKPMEYPRSLDQLIDYDIEVSEEDKEKVADILDKIDMMYDDQLGNLFSDLTSSHSSYMPTAALHDVYMAIAERLAEIDPHKYLFLDLHEYVEFKDITEGLIEKGMIGPEWTEYSGDMKELAARAATGAEQAVAKLYEKPEKTKKQISKREKPVRKLDVSALKPEVEKILGDRASNLEFGEDIGAFMRSLGPHTTKKEKNQIAALLNKYVRAFLDTLIVKVANMYGIKDAISKRAKVTSDSPAYKKKEKSESGHDIYRYDEKHIEKRWREKKDKLKKLEKDIDKVRKQYREDLKSDDERTRAIAAIVGIMDDTAMRIGNEESAKEGTYGASTLKVKHVKGGKGKMTFDFPGKGAIEQNVTLENNEVIKAVRDLMKGKKSDDFIFEVEGKKIWDRAVNRYLKPMGISAKDLRGFHANRLMKEILKKKDFKEALDEVAEIVGHKASTLKNQYLDPELVEKHEKKKEAALSCRALDPASQQTPTVEKQIGDLFSPELDTMTRKEPAEQTKEPEPMRADPTTLVNLNRNVNNINGDIANYPHLQRAWAALAPFLPDGARLTSGWRSDNKQARIIIDYWLNAIWKGEPKKEAWKKNKGFFHTNFPGPSTAALRWWRKQVDSTIPVSGKRYRQLKRDIEPLRQEMTTYIPYKPAKGEKMPEKFVYQPPEPLAIASLGTSNHLRGLAFDVSGVPLASVVSAASYINRNVSDMFVKVLPEKGQDAVHIVVEPSATNVDDFALASALLDYQSLLSAKRASISKRALEPVAEKFVDELENKYFGTGLSKEPPKPISSRTQKPTSKEKELKKKLDIRPGVKLNNVIVTAWAYLHPFLPDSAKMTSGERTAQDQVRIIGDYWKKSKLYQKHPGVEDPFKRSKLLRQNGWVVGPPISKGKNVHLTGRAFDVSGADLEEIAAAARKISDHPEIPVKFSQVLVEPKNNSVHIGIRDAVWDEEKIQQVRRVAHTDFFLSKKAEIAWRDNTRDEMRSIYQDLLDSNPPSDIVEIYQDAFGDVMEISEITVKEAGVLDYPPRVFNDIFRRVGRLAPYFVGGVLFTALNSPLTPPALQNLIRKDLKKIEDMIRKYATPSDMEKETNVISLVQKGESLGLRVPLDINEWKYVPEYLEEIKELLSAGRYNYMALFVAKQTGRASASFLPPSVTDGFVPEMLVNFDGKKILELLLAGLSGMDIIEYYLEMLAESIKHELTHLAQFILNDAKQVREGKSVAEMISEDKEYIRDSIERNEKIRSETRTGLPGHFDAERQHMYGKEFESEEEEAKAHALSDVEFFPNLRSIIELLSVIMGRASIYSGEDKLLPPEYSNIKNLNELPSSVVYNILRERFINFTNTHNVIKNLKSDPAKYNKAMRELYRSVEPLFSTYAEKAKKENSRISSLNIPLSIRAWDISIDNGKLNIELDENIPDVNISDSVTTNNNEDKSYPVEAPKRPRGRPPGSKNKKNLVDNNEDAYPIEEPKRPRGRPPGSKNKKKLIDHNKRTTEPESDKDLEVVKKTPVDDKTWFEKAPQFNKRKENISYNANEITIKDVEDLAKNDPKRYFYLGLNKDKKFKKYEYEALNNILPVDASFYFKFDYHKDKRRKISKLVQDAAEYLAQQNSRAFFYYHLHHNFPELGRGAIVQLIDTNPDSFFDLGLDKDYPEYAGSAGDARNIKDPHKVELEMPEWINGDADHPISLRDRNAAQINAKTSIAEEDPDKTKPGLEPIPMSKIEEEARKREEIVNKLLQDEKGDTDYNERPLDELFDSFVDIRDISPFNVIRYFLFKHYKREKYRPYNEQLLLKLFVVQPSKFFDLELFNDPEFVDFTRRAAFHVAMLEPDYFNQFVAPNFPEISEGYRSLADKAKADGRSDPERRQEMLKQKLSLRDVILSKRAGKLDYPKKMLRDIVMWVEEVSPQFRWKLFSKPVEKLTRVFPIDIRDTDQYQKHEWFRDARKTITDSGWDSELEITLYRTHPYDDIGKRSGGAYNHSEGHHEIWVFSVLDEIKSGDLEDTIKHELTHMMQEVMTTAVQITNAGDFDGLAGMPTSNKPEHDISYRTEGLDDWGKIRRQYRRQDIEFASFLQESISKMQQYVTQFVPEDRHMRFVEFIGEDEFLKDLRDYDSTRYNKALRELYRAFDAISTNKRAFILEPELSCRADSASHIIKWSEMELFGAVSIDVRVVVIETGEIAEAKGFRGRGKKEISKAYRDAQQYVREMQRKYPGARFKK